MAKIVVNDSSHKGFCKKGLCNGKKTLHISAEIMNNKCLNRYGGNKCRNLKLKTRN